MANTITFEMNETQAKSFEKLLDATLEILRKWEEESPNRDARFDKTHEEIMRKLNETEKIMEKTSKRIAKWEIPLES